jgi:hypothetical protein
LRPPPASATVGAQPWGRGLMLTPETTILAALVAAALIALLGPFVAGPVRMHRRSWHPTEPDFVPDDEAALPAEAREVAAELRALGFADRGTWRHVGSPAATSRVAVLEHPRTLDAAQVIAVAAGSRRTVALALSTRFAGGEKVVTSNARVTVGFPQPPGLTAAWLPDVRDPEELFIVHAELRDAVGSGRRIALGPDPAGVLRAEAAATIAAWLAAGFYRLDPTDDRKLRPTWKGAVLVTWRLLWPVKPLYRARRRRATRELLARYGIAVEGEREY